MKHYTVTFQPDGKIISIHSGVSILEAAEQAGIILNSVCGGAGTCGKCAVSLGAGGEEVLSCQHKIESNLTVIIEPESRLFESRILEHGIDRQVKVAPSILEKKPELAKTAGKVFGAALDIGTSTVVAKLIDMSDGRCAATAATDNPQIRFGDNIISRIAYGETEGGLDKLHKMLIESINKLIGRLCEKGGIKRSDIYEVTAAGNTAMSHIFLKFPVRSLGQAPYKAYCLEAQDRAAKEMGIDINPAGSVHTIENIAGFVGSDTTAVALAVEMEKMDQMTLVVDIGTNGELILGTKDKMFAASCAAGPALEGARINQGSRAVNGAIERVLLKDGDIELDIIGAERGAAARSICGSGLIDAVAVMLDAGMIEATGKLVKKEQVSSKVPDDIADRIIEQDGQPGFVLARNTNNNCRPVILTQEDIRETQLAKAAIGAGIKLLQKKMGVADGDIEQVLLAGAFGNYIKRESAKRIGLLCDVDIEKIHFVGNAASVGAQMVLVSSECRSLVVELVKKIEYVEIANEPDFQAVFADSLMFGTTQ